MTKGIKHAKRAKLAPPLESAKNRLHEKSNFFDVRFFGDIEDKIMRQVRFEVSRAKVISLWNNSGKCIHSFPLDTVTNAGFNARTRCVYITFSNKRKIQEKCGRLLLSADISIDKFDISAIVAKFV